MRAVFTRATIVAALALVVSCDRSHRSARDVESAALPRRAVASLPHASSELRAHDAQLEGAKAPVAPGVNSSGVKRAKAEAGVLNSPSPGGASTTMGIGKVATRGRGAGAAAYGSGEGQLSSMGSAMVLGGKADRDMSITQGSGGLGLRGTGAGGGGVGYGVGAGGLGMSGTGAGGYDPAPPPSSGGTFQSAGVNPTTSTREDPLSTFAIDVDTGSWFFARGFLTSGTRPPKESVRVEEWLNAFRYGYAGPSDGRAFTVHTDGAPSPFKASATLVRIGVQGRRIANEDRKPANLTFLVDVSGSMQQPDKLPLAKSSLGLLVDALDARDTVAIVTYAGETRVVLPATSAANKGVIHEAIAALRNGGGTDMGSGVELAYREAGKHAGSDRVSRVIVLSDGDANIGKIGHEEILASIKGYVSEGVTLSTVGFGRGNYNDRLMEQLADAGDGNYTYIDTEDAARRFFVDDLVSTIQVIAKDVKIQVEWNPDAVTSYRLLGYENRDVADKDFANDKVDGGEVGAGHAVTALYEIELARPLDGAARLATVRVRAKQPQGGASQESTFPLAGAAIKATLQQMDDDGRFAAATAMAAEVLRESPAAKYLSLDDAITLAESAAVGPHATERRAFAAALRSAGKVAHR